MAYPNKGGGPPTSEVDIPLGQDQQEEKQPSNEYRDMKLLSTMKALLTRVLATCPAPTADTSAQSSSVKLISKRYRRGHEGIEKKLCTNVVPPDFSQVETDLTGDDKRAVIGLLNRYADYFIEGVPVSV
ncbi:unnamed protein product [Parnassius apollo]|uniref:(apollo) hypothetical protein n=1 Tax=Parnassius apollo TaxID=110799 RepID=A0A8S3W7C9_PARAO|nr:unnamed protein product [Parnassius apollo]